jgi:hypothetical protein
MEVTKLLKPSISVSRIGDSASVVGAASGCIRRGGRQTKWGRPVSRFIFLTPIVGTGRRVIDLSRRKSFEIFLGQLARGRSFASECFADEKVFHERARLQSASSNTLGVQESRSTFRNGSRSILARRDLSSSSGADGVIIVTIISYLP